MIHFTNDMKIGVPNIDSQHSGLINFANRAASLCDSNPTKAEMKECLDFLGNYVLTHFKDEEQLQIESKYPRYKQHKAIHDEFIQTFKALYGEFERNGPTQLLSNVLNGTVLAWIITHIKGEDMTFGKHYEKTKLQRLTTLRSE